MVKLKRLALAFSRSLVPEDPRVARADDRAAEELFELRRICLRRSREPRPFYSFSRNPRGSVDISGTSIRIDRTGSAIDAITSASNGSSICSGDRYS